MSENVTIVMVAVIIGIIAIFTIGVIISKLYRRASKETSFVRTGFGGQKVIMNGGALIFPVLHETIPVNMNTLRLAVNRANEQALITLDRMRVDVVAEFYVRVQPTIDAIANAAQTLGIRTTKPDTLKELVEGKFVDALRSVAAEMSMEELHEKRVDFVQKVQQVVSEDLLKNGLELETVSLTGLDQTGMDYFNPNNAFDAEGLTRLTEEIQRRKKIRNDIEQDTAVKVNSKNLEAAKELLAIQREEEYAKLEQEREVEIRRAQQIADIAKEKAAKQQSAEQARIAADQQIAQSRINSERAVEEEKILKDKAVEISRQDRDIAVAEKSKQQSLARAEADAAKAKAVEAEERVSTAREREIAEREKSIQLIEASKMAERAAIALTVAATAEKTAAVDRAEALRESARAEGDRQRIAAEAESEAEKMRAEAARIRYAVDADGSKSLNEAANLLSNEQIALKIKLQLMEKLEAIIRESVKPMERIDGIKIVHVEGLGGGGSHGASHPDEKNGGSGNLADQVVNSALRYRAQAPLLDSLMKEIGLHGGGLADISDALETKYELYHFSFTNCLSGNSHDSTPNDGRKVLPVFHQLAGRNSAPTLSWAPLLITSF